VRAGGFELAGDRGGARGEPRHGGLAPAPRAGGLPARGGAAAGTATRSSAVHGAIGRCGLEGGIMKDPPRLLETTRSNLGRGRDRDCGSLERGLLRSAYSDRAPDAVRAHVLESVNRVLAEAAPRLPASSAAG